MEYIERTREVLRLLKRDTFLRQHIANIFASHTLGTSDAAPIWCWRGSQRTAYEAGVLEVPGRGTLTLILKILTRVDAHAAWQWAREENAEEFGAFETYYSFAAGLLDIIGFSDEEAYQQFRTACVAQGRGDLLRDTLSVFRLNSWPGTQIASGDFGALPYFQMAVRYDTWFGWLTEGLPPIVVPKRTAWPNEDYQTIENDRIIDLGRAQARLCTMNNMGASSRDSPDFFSLAARGKKYLESKHVLRLP